MLLVMEVKRDFKEEKKKNRDEILYRIETIKEDVNSNSYNNDRFFRLVCDVD